MEYKFQRPGNSFHKTLQYFRNEQTNERTNERASERANEQMGERDKVIILLKIRKQCESKYSFFLLFLRLNNTPIKTRIKRIPIDVVANYRNYTYDYFERYHFEE